MKVGNRNELCVFGAGDTSYHKNDNYVNGKMIMLNNNKRGG